MNIFVSSGNNSPLIGCDFSCSGLAVAPNIKVRDVEGVASPMVIMWLVWSSKMDATMAGGAGRGSETGMRSGSAILLERRICEDVLSVVSREETSLLMMDERYATEKTGIRIRFAGRMVAVRRKEYKVECNQSM